jgi:para-aminobenzoate synthetase/4-amino-4-deoxychorismate lyase
MEENDLRVLGLQTPHATYYDLPHRYYQLIQNSDDVVLLETSKYDADNHKTFLFINPIETLRICSADQVPRLTAEIERYLKEGYYLAGYFAYECGHHFEDIAALPTSEVPIAFFGVFQSPVVFDHLSGESENEPPDLHELVVDERPLHHRHVISGLRMDMSVRDYSKKLDRIKDYILSGDVYQINYTTRYRFDFEGSTLSLYKELKRKQRVPYGAFIRAGGTHILCFSPELFFRYRCGTITTKPMKGTAQRGRISEEDRYWESWLKQDEKNKAENLMIVDLLRNDLGRVSEIGSVRVRELFSVERYQTLFQMTSTIQGKVKRDTTYYDILRSLFPCGSVTGAPKIRAMQIIHELETTPRGVYTGAIGYFSPEHEAVFNVSIRTLVVDGNKGEMGVGSGIVFDSIPENEYAECELKARFLTAPAEEVELIETVLWHDGFPFLERHLRRLQDSARYFDYCCDVDSVLQELGKVSKTFLNGKKYKVRLLLDSSGRTSVEQSVIHENGDSNAVALSTARTNSGDRFLFHKTTNRPFYDDLYTKACKQGLADIIFMNEKGQITEGTRNNIVVRKGRYLMTPPVDCGLLNGVFRQHLLETEPDIAEKVLTPHDLQTADAIYICNAVRGMREAQLHKSYVD